MPISLTVFDYKHLVFWLNFAFSPSRLLRLDYDFTLAIISTFISTENLISMASWLSSTSLQKCWTKQTQRYFTTLFPRLVYWNQYSHVSYGMVPSFSFLWNTMKEVWHDSLVMNLCGLLVILAFFPKCSDYHVLLFAIIDSTPVPK